MERFGIQQPLQGHVAVAAVVRVAVDAPAQRKVIQNDVIAVINSHDIFSGRVSLVLVTKSHPQIPDHHIAAILDDDRMIANRDPLSGSRLPGDCQTRFVFHSDRCR